MLRIIKFLLTGDWHLHTWKIIYDPNCKSESGGYWKRHYTQCIYYGKIRLFQPNWIVR